MFVITGGGSGIGKALALSLAKQGKDVLIIGRREHLLAETAANSANIQYLCADVATAEGLQLINAYLQPMTRLDALVNNAGTLNPMANLKEVSSNEWQHAINTNLNPAFYLVQNLYDKLAQGRVLNISSGAAHFAIKGWGAYCVTKAALSMITQCWQLESDSVSFASVMPGIIDTDMQAVARSAESPDAERGGFYQRLKDEDRLIKVETVASFLSWLLLEVDKEAYVAQEWDIYDTSHHAAWLKVPQHVPHWDI